MIDRLKGKSPVSHLICLTLALLIFIAAASLSLTAYNLALRGQFKRWRMTSFALILATLMYTILDYDMMMRGLIRVDHSSLEILLDEMGLAMRG